MEIPSHPHAMALADLESALATDFITGLSAPERAKRLEQFGPNELVLAAPISAWQILLSQFKDLMVLILMGAAVVALVAWKLEGGKGLPSDAVIIGAILLLNGLLGFVQEYRAEQMMQKLQEVAATSKLRVITAGQSLEVDRAELVPGDLIKLKEGDRVPADCVLTNADRLQADESMLTGESVPVSKTPGPVKETASLDERHGSLFAGPLGTRRLPALLAFDLGRDVCAGPESSVRTGSFGAAAAARPDRSQSLHHHTRGDLQTPFPAAHVIRRRRETCWYVMSRPSKCRGRTKARSFRPLD